MRGSLRVPFGIVGTILITYSTRSEIFHCLDKSRRPKSVFHLVLLTFIILIFLQYAFNTHVRLKLSLRFAEIFGLKYMSRLELAI